MKPRVRPQLGKVIPIGTGSYTEIGVVIAPEEANPGQTIQVVFNINNLYTETIAIAATAIYDSTEFSIFPDYAWVDPGIPHSFNGSFVMPDKDTTVTIYSFYWIGNDWRDDDTKQVTIRVITLEPTFSSLSANYRRAT